MDAEEIARHIGELETRVERLRAMYEQYFMGIERIEPLTMRKDVDRRLWALRREQIRNTGLRFKLETTIQRYNTYQQYWQRIVREIEAGTYQRDFGRAAQRFGEAVTAFGKRRQKMFEKGAERKAERDARRTGAAGSSQAPPPEVVDELEPASETFDVTFDDDGPASTRRDVVEPAEPLELEMRDGLSSEPPPMPAPPAEGRRGPPPAPNAPRPTGAGAPAAPGIPRPAVPGTPPAAPPRAPMASSVGQAAQPAAPPRAPMPSSAGQGPPLPPPRAPMASSAGQGGGLPLPPPRASMASSAGIGAPPVPPPRPPMASVSGVSAAKGATPAATPAKPAIPAAAPTRPSPTGPQAALAAGARPPTGPQPALGAGARPPTGPQPPALGAGARPAPAPAAPVKPVTPAVARPAAVAPKPAPAPVEKPPPPRAPAPSVSDAHKPPAVLSEDNNLSPIRMRQIYGQFVEAKRKANESTASVTYEKIAANLENAAKELRAKHNARSVDFEVVMKNGKPVLKPVVKG